MNEGPLTPEGAPRRRLGLHRTAVYYAILAPLTAAVIAIVIAAGSGKHAEPVIAGGYNAALGRACLGGQFDVSQSGQFVSLDNAQGTLSGNLKLKQGRLTGTVHCVDHLSAAIDARYRAGTLQGTIGGGLMSAQLRRSPPPPGAPKPLAPGSISGAYQLAPSSACLGASVTLSGSGSSVAVMSGKVRTGAVTYHDGTLAGALLCPHGGSVLLTGTAAGRQLDLLLVGSGASAAPRLPGAAAAREHLQATKQRTPDNTVVAFFVATLVVMLFARLCGSLMPKIGQPRVMGEVLAGIILGPTVFGAIAPSLQARLFASDIVPYIGVAANLGLIFYMFLIGLEVDLRELRGRVGTTLAISNTGLAIPMMLGMAAAVPLYTLLAPSTRYVAFALFLGVSMSVTAFPVLARIVSERRMLKRPLGTLALSAAAIDDVSAWFLIALATAVAGAGTGIDVLVTIGSTALFVLAMAFIVRPILARAAIA